MMRSHSFKHFLSPFVILLFQYPTTQFAGEKDNHAPAEGADRCVVIVSLFKVSDYVFTIQQTQTMFDKAYLTVFIVLCQN